MDGNFEPSSGSKDGGPSAPGSSHSEDRAAGRFAFTFGYYAQKEPWTDRRSLSWPELVTTLTSHEAGPKEGTCIVPAVFRGTGRHKSDAD